MIAIPSHGAKARVLGALALCSLTLAACGDPIEPGSLPELEVEVSATAFADTDPLIGTDELVIVEVRNDGGGEVTLSPIELAGADASSFALQGDASITLSAGEARMLQVAFVPTTEGDKSTILTITSDDPARRRVEIALAGRAARFQYRQVDRIGIPDLNTVFNHPSGTAGFDKTAYNSAAPSGDVAMYAGQFEVVLGAVGNADPPATAALLLPDELPVNMGAATTAFAQLTGRALADDAIDIALFVTVGVPGLQSDNVDANDKAFRAVFPYVAERHN